MPERTWRERQLSSAMRYVSTVTGGSAKGGHARNAKLSPERRREIAAMGAKARMEKRGKP